MTKLSYDFLTIAAHCSEESECFLSVIAALPERENAMEYYYVQDDSKFNGTWTIRIGRNGIVEYVAASKREAQKVCDKLNDAIDTKS